MVLEQRYVLPLKHKEGQWASRFAAEQELQLNTNLGSWRKELQKFFQLLCSKCSKKPDNHMKSCFSGNEHYTEYIIS